MPVLPLADSPLHVDWLPPLQGRHLGRYSTMVLLHFARIGPVVDIFAVVVLVAVFVVDSLL